MCGISVARGTPATSAASAGARVRMSLTTDVRAHLLQQGQQRPRRLGRVRSLGRVGVRRREHPVFLGRGEAQAGALDRRPPLLPGLDRHLVAAPGQRPPERDRREDVARVAEGGDEEPHARGYRAPRRAG